jgi:pantetheine-phosphate adenylyltransferase
VQRVVCPGSFDPVTNGHLDIIGRAAGLYDEVIVAVLINVTKRSLFTVDERVEMLGQVTSRYANVRIERFHGLLVDFCAANGITAVIKGLRAVSDFEYEMQMAQMNYRMAKVETLFMTTNPLYSFLRSSLVKEIARYGGDVSGLVPETVLSQLRERVAQELSRGEPRAPEYRRPPSSWDYHVPPVGWGRSALLTSYTSTLSCPTHAHMPPAARSSSTRALSAVRRGPRSRSRGPCRLPTIYVWNSSTYPWALTCSLTSSSRRSPKVFWRPGQEPSRLRVSARGAWLRWLTR